MGKKMLNAVLDILENMTTDQYASLVEEAEQEYSNFLSDIELAYATGECVEWADNVWAMVENNGSNDYTPYIDCAEDYSFLMAA